MSRPTFSVVIPTHRRPQLVRQAVDSVLAQSEDDYEIVVSDDEDPPGETWDILRAFAHTDGRVRPVRNPPPHGQVPNTSRGIREARGRWVKLLHDDDTLAPNCLRVFRESLEAVPAASDVRIASCRHDDLLLDGTVRRWTAGRALPRLQLLRRGDAALAMYLFEDTGSSMPSCLCVDRGWLVEHGLWMPAHPGFVSSVDSLWSLRLCTAGDKLIINVPLILKRQEPASITGTFSDAALDAELDLLKELQWRAIPVDRRPPPVRVMQRAVRFRRAAHRLVKRGKPGEAMTLLYGAWDARAWALVARNVLARRWPNRFRRTTLTAL